MGWAFLVLMCLAPARAQSRESVMAMSELDEGGRGGGGIDAMNDKHLTSIIRDRDRALVKRATDIKKEMREIVTEPCAPNPSPFPSVLRFTPAQRLGIHLNLQESLRQFSSL